MPDSNPPIYRLPFDILHEVFQIAVAYRTQTPLVLSHVSRRWREYALESPGLWTSIVFNSKSKRVAYDSQVYWERQVTFIERSESQPLEIEVIANRDFGCEALPVLKDVLRIIVPHAERWRSFKFTPNFRWRADERHRITTEVVDRIQELRLPRLEILRISSHIEYRNDDGVGLHASSDWPALRELDLQWLPFDYSSPALENLTTLRLWDQRIFHPATLHSVITFILHRAQRLVTFNISGGDHTFGQAMLFPETPSFFVHDRLEVLKTRATWMDFAGVVRCVHLPGLREYQAGLESAPVRHSWELINVLSDPSRSLDRLDRLALDLDGRPLDDDSSLWLALQNLPALEELILIEYSRADLIKFGTLCPKLAWLTVFAWSKTAPYKIAESAMLELVRMRLRSAPDVRPLKLLSISNERVLRHAESREALRCIEGFTYDTSRAYIGWRREAAASSYNW